MAQRVLVVDVGGTHLKILASGQRTPRKIASGPKMTAQLMCNWVKKAASDWQYEVAAVGYPGPVVHGRPVHEPYNMSGGWVGFDYAKELGCPVRVINDAAMQAVGSYQGGRMLFLGLGTGLGSAMIVDGVVEPLELAHLPYKKGKTYEVIVYRVGTLKNRPLDGAPRSKVNHLESEILNHAGQFFCSWLG
jgi:polyphosphate glucokinase